MENLNQYSPIVKQAFSDYLDQKLDAVDLILKLQKLEKKIKRETKLKGEFWLRFFKGDTLATDIRNIERDLENPYSNSFKYMTECMEIAIQPETEIEIYIS